MEGFKVKETARWIMPAIIFFLFPSLSQAAAVHDVKRTVHNLGSTYKGGSFHTLETSEICIFCHTPHNAVPGKKFLWNRIPQAGVSAELTVGFQIYTASPSINFTKSGITISDISKMCMSCHDGVTAMNSMANPRAPLFTSVLSDVYGSFGEWGPDIGEGDIGPPVSGGGDLTNDHPISFEYQDAQTNDPRLKSRDAGLKTVGNLPLWDRGDGKYRVECVTCHDPHVYYGNPLGPNKRENCEDAAACLYKPFLRKSNSSSSLCFTCHDK